MLDLEIRNLHYEQYVTDWMEIMTEMEKMVPFNDERTLRKELEVLKSLIVSKLSKNLH